jgi:hypothetical protein
VFVKPTNTSIGSAMAMPGEVENAISAKPMPTAVTSRAGPGRRLKCASEATVSLEELAQDVRPPGRPSRRTPR